MVDKVHFGIIDSLGALPVVESPFELQKFLDKSTAFFGKPHSWLLDNGRMAMTKLFETMNLAATDEIYITSSFDFPNISACVTCTIFNFCKPARIITENTKAIFIIHEFGVPHPRTFELKALAKERSIPLIEDCAHTINSFFDNGQQVGSIGDWTIVTFPKIFPVHIGGLLLGNNNLNISSTTNTSVLKEANVVSSLWDTISWITERRAAAYELYIKLLSNSSYEFVFSETKNIAPWFFPLKVGNASKTIGILRENNIDCGLWHGTNIVVLPLHQYLTSEEIYYICNLLIKIQ